MTTNDQLKKEIGNLWPVDEPLDFREYPTVQGYYYDDLGRVANANADWIERVRQNYPELLSIIPPIPQKENKSKTEKSILDKVKSLKR